MMYIRLHKVVAVTIDDDPNPVYTQQILAIFLEVSGKATFFMIGKQMNEHPEIVKAVTEQIHEIGNQTYSHPKLKLTTLKKAECLNELTFTDSFIKIMTGKKHAVFRPPYLDDNKTALIAKSLIRQSVR